MATATWRTGDQAATATPIRWVSYLYSAVHIEKKSAIMTMDVIVDSIAVIQTSLCSSQMCLILYLTCTNREMVTTLSCFQ